MSVTSVDPFPIVLPDGLAGGVSFKPTVRDAHPGHLFDQAVKVTPLDASALVPEVKALIELHPSYASATVYEANLNPAFGNTPTMPNGGHTGSLILNACMTHQHASRAADPLSITFDYLVPTKMGKAFIIVRNDSRAGGRMHDVYADLYQIQPKEETTCLVQTVRSVALFGTFSTKGPSASDPGHYGPHLALEDTPVPHPKSWYLPPKICMISQQFDLLVDLETDRRPRADYWVRHHPPGVGNQQHADLGVMDEPAKDAVQMALKSSTLPLRAPSARPIDLITLPTLADFRRPAMENVLKEDASSVLDEPTRQWAYPTLSLTLRFFHPVAGAEWMHIAWREHAQHGRVTSEFKMETEAGDVACVGNMDTVMVPFAWFKG